MAAYAYILRCADQKLYYGSTGDLSQRLSFHREGRSRWTSSRLPVELLWYQAFETLAQARRMEQSLKGGRTRRKKIELMIRSFPQELLAPFV